MSAKVHGPQRRCTPHFRFDLDEFTRPRLVGYIDVWLGGSLVDFGFELTTRQSLDPALGVGVQFEAAPNSLIDRLLCMLTGVRR